MQGKKDFLANCLFRSGLFRLFRARTHNNCIVVCYHRIKATDADTSAFDDSVMGPNQEEFEQQVRWLKTNNDVLSEAELISVVRGEHKPPQRSVVITFDDGYIDNYTLAYPVLKSLNTSAIFFIPTKAIEERYLGWWDLISFLVKMSKKNEITLLGERFSQRRSFDRVVHLVLSLIYQNKQTAEEMLIKLSKACEVDLPDKEIQSKELMTWDQLREVSKDNIAIGSHTHSHTIMSSLDLETQKKELELSKQIIEKEIGLKVRSMSYPCGNYNNFNIVSKESVGATGYDLGFSFLTGINSYGKIDPLDVKRIVVSNYFPHFVSTFAAPQIFCDDHDSIVSAGGLYD